jgi:methionine-gamma-lyase
VAGAMTGRTRLIFVETFANPTLAVADIPRLADLAHRNGARLVVDNTFSPVVVSPARLGADIVVHSLTKFVSGASDVIAGAICGTHDFVGSLMDVNTGALMLLGPTMDPFVAEKLSLRLPHLGIRMAEHGRRALALCERLETLGYPAIYPGLATHPDHALLTRLANPGYGHSGVFGLDLGSLVRAERFLEILQNDVHFGFIAVSLGYFDSLLTVPSESVSSELGSGEQTRAGITEGLVRIALGYTGTLDQRWDQLAGALRLLEDESQTRSA